MLVSGKSQHPPSSEPDALTCNPSGNLGLHQPHLRNPCTIVAGGRRRYYTREELERIVQYFKEGKEMVDVTWQRETGDGWTSYTSSPGRVVVVGNDTDGYDVSTPYGHDLTVSLPLNEALA